MNSCVSMGCIGINIMLLIHFSIKILNMDRAEKIIEIRPVLDIESFSNQSKLELFQNGTIRPILKFQNNLFIVRFLKDPLTKKSKYDGMNQIEKRKHLDHRLKTDKKFQKELIGMTTGLMTSTEYIYYLENSQELNKRIMSMLAARIMDQTLISKPLSC